MKNCWEFTKCGREPGGEKVQELGECPVPKQTRLDGFNGGDNAGRACWLVQASLCEGEKQGDFYDKIGNCIKCDFLKAVYKEQGDQFSYGMNELAESSKDDNPESK